MFLRLLLLFVIAVGAAGCASRSGMVSLYAYPSSLDNYQSETRRADVNWKKLRLGEQFECHDVFGRIALTRVDDNLVVFEVELRPSGEQFVWVFVSADTPKPSSLTSYPFFKGFTFDVAIAHMRGYVEKIIKGPAKPFMLCRTWVKPSIYP